MRNIYLHLFLTNNLWSTKIAKRKERKMKTVFHFHTVCVRPNAYTRKIVDEEFSQVKIRYF